MNILTALAVVIGAMGGILTWLLLGPAAGIGLSLWACFIAWGSFYHNGGGDAGLQKAFLGAVWGAILATAALVAMPQVGMGAVGAGICVAVTVAILIMGSQIPAFSSIPSAVYGYASTAAYALMKAGATPLGADLATSPLLNIVASMAVGVLCGYVSEKVAGSLAAKTVAS